MTRALLLLLLLASPAFADPKGAIVRIPSHGGSGTVIATGPGWSLILSAAHCFEGSARTKPIALDVIMPSAAVGRVGIQLLGTDKAADVALVRLNYGPLPHISPVAPSGFQPGPCLSGGFDDMKFPGEYRLANIIERSPDGYYYTREAPWHGRSGGGLIDARTGYLVGVCSGYTGQHSRNEAARGKGVYAGLPSILAFLRRTKTIQVEEYTQPGRPDDNPFDIRNRAPLKDCPT